MSIGLRRSLSDIFCRFLQSTMPPALQSWGRAIRNEAAAIPDDTRALFFALGSICGLMPRVIAYHLLWPFVAPIASDAHLQGGEINMMPNHEPLFRPRALGIACAAMTVLLGLAYMAIGGAPFRYLAINAAAFVLGLIVLMLIGRVSPESWRWPGALTLMLGAFLFATALLGERVEGAARWVKFGPFFVQPSLVVLPAMTVAFVRSRNLLSTLGMMIAAVAMAVQPDRAMAGMLVAGLAVVSLVRADRSVVSAFIISLMAFLVTLARADTLPAMPFVDQIYFSSFHIHAFVGLAVLLGSALLIVPAGFGALYDKENCLSYSVFGAIWIALIMAAALGNYPTPVVGYSGGAVLGYVLCLIGFPQVARPVGDAGLPTHLECGEIAPEVADLHIGSAVSFVAKTA